MKSARQCKYLDYSGLEQIFRLFKHGAVWVGEPGGGEQGVNEVRRGPDTAAHHPCMQPLSIASKP